MPVPYPNNDISAKDDNGNYSIGYKDASGVFRAVSEIDALPTVASPGTATPTSLISKISRFIGWAMFNATPTTRTEGQAWPLQADANGNLLISLGSLLAGEDLTRWITKVQQRFQPYPISLAGSYSVKTWSGLLWRIIVQWGTTWTIKVYDNTSAVGTPILDFDSTVAIASYDVNAEFYVWCFVVTSANTKVTVMTGV